jgi:hypothetical protein
MDLGSAAPLLLLPLFILLGTTEVITASGPRAPRLMSAFHARAPPAYISA